MSCEKTSTLILSWSEIREYRRFVHPDVASLNTSATVGIGLNGCSIQSCLVGEPGWLSRQLDVGDLIMKVDGDDVSPQSVVS